LTWWRMLLSLYPFYPFSDVMSNKWATIYIVSASTVCGSGLFSVLSCRPVIGIPGQRSASFLLLDLYIKSGLFL
jgi:hypothetical protein